MVTMDTDREEVLQEALEYLKHQNTGFLATHGKAGLRVSPVSIFLNNEMSVFLHCFGGEKLINISENPEACLLVIEDKWSLDPGFYEGVQVFGEVKEIKSDSDLYERAEEWCPYTHQNKMTLLELLPQKLNVVDYPDGEKRKRFLELTKQ